MIIKTFRLRLTIFYAFTIALISFFFVGAVYIYHKKESFDAVDKALLNDIKTELLPNFKQIMPTKNAETIKRRGNEYFQIIKKEGSVVIASLNKKSHGLPINRDFMLKAFEGKINFETLKYNNENFRVLYFPVDRENIIRISTSLLEKEKEIDHFKSLIISFFPFLLFLSIGLSWFLAGKAVLPIVKIKSNAEKIIHDKSNKRIDVGIKGKEIDELINIFNDMLDSNANLISTQKRFTSNVSHEIRSPLTSLRGNIEVSLRKKRTSEEYEVLLRNNLSDVMRLSTIIDNLLFLTRAENNILEFRRHWFDINHLLKNILERLNERIISAGITLIEDYQKNLELNGDREMLEQAFINLIENAIKYTPQGGTIRIKTYKEENAIKINISDTGIGINEEDIPHIFERFYRGTEGSSKKPGGTGLGLAITKWIINAHNGNISVKSAFNTGSEFLIVFPATLD